MKDQSKALIKLIDQLETNQPVGAEIGVWRAGNVMHLLDRIESLEMFLIDAWDPSLYDGDTTDDDLNEETQSEAIENEHEARRRLEPFQDRIKIIKEDHRDAGDQVNDLDFVFLDARHDYKGTIQQIAYWYNQVKEGGFVAGHDYDRPEFNFEVKEAVDDMSFLLNQETSLHQGYVWCWWKS